MKFARSSRSPSHRAIAGSSGRWTPSWSLFSPTRLERRLRRDDSILLMGDVSAPGPESCRQGLDGNRLGWRHLRGAYRSGDGGVKTMSLSDLARRERELDAIREERGGSGDSHN